MRIALYTLCWPIIFLTLLLIGCGEKPESTQTSIRAEPLVIYADYADEDYLPDLFTAFTEHSGVRVTVRHADESTIVNDVIGDRGTPPADVLLAPSVHGIWSAADEGALRRLGNESNLVGVPENLRDPDGLWIAMSYRTAVFLYDSTSIDGTSLVSYASLADGRFRGKLCLSSSELSVNRVLIAMLIDQLGTRPAEIAVRGWIANLALPVFESEPALVGAIDAGTCALGIVTSSTALAAAGDKIKIAVPDVAYADVEGLGVARHARQPELALQFIDWLLSANVQAAHRERTLRFSARGDDDIDAESLSDRDVGIAAWQNDAAISLAERAGYR